MTQVWNVLLPGPSLAKLVARPEGMIVSVNKAILHEVQPDFFCALDTPLSLGARSKPGEWNYTMWKRLELLKPKVWVHNGVFEEWRKWGFPDSQGWKWRGEPDLPWLPDLKKKTMFYAILGCLMHGANVIHLYGCDLAGGQYFDTPEMHKDNVDSRWKLESMQLYSIIDAAEKQGIVIGRR